MTQKPVPDDLIIDSPIGNIVIPTEPLKLVLNYLANNIEKTDQKRLLWPRIHYVVLFINGNCESRL